MLIVGNFICCWDLLEALHELNKNTSYIPANLLLIALSRDTSLLTIMLKEAGLL
jgi:hypothetical protein